MVTITRLDCGDLRGDLAMFERGAAAGDVTLPVNAWLIHHPRGTVLFDTGMPASFVAGSARTRLMSEELNVSFTAGDTIAAQMEALDHDPARVDYVIVSHLHFDHVGGLSMIPNATLVVQRKEWEAGISESRDPDAEIWHPREDYDLGHSLCLIDGEHDLFGDGSVVCIPTPGHTIGHHSLRLRLATGQQVVLAADCCYFARVLDSGKLPTFGYDLHEQLRSVKRLRKLRDGGAMVVPGHDIHVSRSIARVLGNPD